MIKLNSLIWQFQDMEEYKLKLPKSEYVLRPNIPAFQRVCATI